MLAARGRAGRIDLWRVGAIAVMLAAALWAYFWPQGWWPVSVPARLGLLACVVLLGYAVSDIKAARVLFRALVVALPIGLLGWAAFLLLEPRFEADERRFLYQGLMAGGTIAGGWVFTFMLQSWREEARREARVNETLLALKAEIFDFLSDTRANWDKLAAENGWQEHRPDATMDGLLVKERERLLAEEKELPGRAATLAERLLHRPDTDPMPRRIASAGNGAGAFHPFVPTGKQPLVFETASGALALLPPVILQDIVGFYTHLRDLETMSRDLQSEAFRDLDAARRADIFFDYEDLILRATYQACHTWRVINAAARPAEADIYPFWLLDSQDIPHEPVDHAALVPADAASETERSPASGRPGGAHG